MAEQILPGAIHRETEFALAPDGSRRIVGACGPNALAMGDAWSNQRGAVDTWGVYADMKNRGLLSDPTSGASTIEGLRQEAISGLGLPVVDFRQYTDAPWTDWRAWYMRHVGQHYIVMETQNGQAFVDALSGQGENATNLRRHFIGVVGHHDGGYSPRAGRDLPPGWWCCDGDNYAGGNTSANGFRAADVLQFYPDNLMIAAQPCAALALAAKAAGGSMAGVPTGWHDANNILTAPNGKTVQHGFRQHVLDAAAWHPALMPLGGEYGTPARQDFALSLVWGGQAANEVAGPDYPAQIAALQAEVARLKQQAPASLSPYQLACIAFAESAFATTSAEQSAHALKPAK